MGKTDRQSKPVYHFSAQEFRALLVHLERVQQQQRLGDIEGRLLASCCDRFSRHRRRSGTGPWEIVFSEAELAAFGEWALNVGNSVEQRTHTVVRKLNVKLRALGNQEFFGKSGFVPYLGVRQREGEFRVVLGRGGASLGNGPGSLIDSAIEYLRQTRPYSVRDLLDDDGFLSPEEVASDKASPRSGPCIQLVGRRSIRKRISDFLATHDEGCFLIEGPPGIGKSVLMESLAEELDQLAGEGEVFLFQGQQIGFFEIESCVQSLVDRLAQFMGIRTSPLPRSTDSQLEQFRDRLSEAAAFMRSKQTGGNPREGVQEATSKEDHSVHVNSRLILLIDGLDEADDPSRLIRFIAKGIPQGVFFGLSTRSGAHTRTYPSLPNAMAPIKIDPRGEENLADATEYLDSVFSHWSGTDRRRIAEAAEGNFLILSRVHELMKGRPSSEREAREILKRLGTLKEDKLASFYEISWELLHKKARAQDESEDINCLLGILTVAFAPLTPTQLNRFLGDGWTTNRFERALAHVRPFLTIEEGDTISLLQNLKRPSGCFTGHFERSF